MEGGLRRLRDRDDGAVHRALADEPERCGEKSRGRLLQRPQGDCHTAGHDHVGYGHGQRLCTPAGPEPEALQDLKEKLEQEIQARKELEKLNKQIEITITSEGLRIELIEDKNGTFYQSGSAKLSPSGQELLALLATELKTLPNQLQIEGHTDAAQYSNDANYSNWELSADRANSARRLLQQDGVRADQVTQVRGYADQLLRVKSNPYDPSNRRISILVKNNDNAPPPPQLKHARGRGWRSRGLHLGLRPARRRRPRLLPPRVRPAPAKPPAATPAKPGMFSKLTGLLPGAKK
jgi:outer membrane protein OmpA-like peptidoglycan-associated protein